MRIRSPLAELVDVLDQVRQSAELNEDVLIGNEDATRAALIDPILRSLGWDTGNPTMVEVEKKLPEARADYALFDTNGELRVVIEAKSLGTNLTDLKTLRGTVKYAYSAEIPNVFLTDGIEWHHLTTFDPQELTPTTSLNLDDTNLVKVASYLVEQLDAAHFWPEAKDVDELAQQMATLESTVSSLQKDLVRLSSSRAGKQIPEIKAPTHMVPVDDRNMVALSELPVATGTKPRRFRLPDRTVLTVSSWSDVLRESVKYALETNPELPIPFADKAGKKINLIGLARPPKTISYTETEHNSEIVFIRTNYSANGCVENALHILENIPARYRDVEPAVTYS